MKFGSEEWFKQLKEMVKFPAVFGFYYNKKDNLIQVAKVYTKGKVENVRYKDIAPSPIHFHPKETALIKVKMIDSADDYHKELLDLQDMWGTTFKDTEK